jgi:hypothetical protein
VVEDDKHLEEGALCCQRSGQTASSRATCGDGQCNYFTNEAPTVCGHDGVQVTDLEGRQLRNIGALCFFSFAATAGCHPIVPHERPSVRSQNRISRLRNRPDSKSSVCSRPCGQDRRGAQPPSLLPPPYGQRWQRRSLCMLLLHSR